jgi:predicted  nucleic acid-binding Zn-ribbon protein
VPPEFQPEIPMFGAIVNTHASDRGNEPVTWNQFHTFANQMDTNFSIVNSRIHTTHREILEMRAQFIQLNEKINRLDERINRLEVRLDERINRLDERINGLDEKINGLDEKINGLDEKINGLDEKINGLDEKINQLRGEFISFKEEMRLVPVKIAGWVAGAMIGSSGVIFGGFQLLRGLL